MTRIERRNSALAGSPRSTLTYTAGQWVWSYKTIVTIYQGSKKDKDDKVLKAKLSLNWTGSYKILAVRPAGTAGTPDRRPMATKLLFLDLPGDMPGVDSWRRVPVVRWKPCFNLHDLDDMPKYPPAGLTRYVLHTFAAKCPPYCVTDDGVSVSVERLEVTQISRHRTVRGRGGVFAVLYETHWKGILAPSRETEADL